MEKQDVVNITVIGVGGGGGNMINHMSQYSLFDINLVSANTDNQVLANAKGKIIQLGRTITKGLGAGMKPEKGEQAAEESEAEIREVLKGSDIVFVTAGMGGGTGTGAAPVVSRIAKEVGALTIAVITTPFKFEGRKRTKLANQGIEILKGYADSLIVIPNERLLQTVEKNLGIKESFQMVDSVLSRAVNGISTVILGNGEADINLDFSDFKTVMTHKGSSLMSIGASQGEDASTFALENALTSALLDDVDITGAMGALIHFEMNSEYSLVELGASMEVIEDKISEDADVIFGTTINDQLAPDEVKVTVIISGIIDKEAEEEAEKEKNAINNINVLKKPIARLNMTARTEEEVLDIPTFLRANS